MPAAPTPPLNPLIVEKADTYRRDPVFFAKEVLGVDLWSKQVEIARSVRDNRHTLIQSCHGSGKSWLISVLSIWRVCAFPGSVSILVSSNAQQVKNILMGNVQMLLENSLIDVGGRPNERRFALSPTSYIFGMSINKAKNRMEGAQGYHNPVGAAFFIDEASSMPKNVFTSVSSAMGSDNSRMLVSGNPLNNTSYFYDIATTGKKYNKIEIDIHEIPNFIEGREVIPGLSGRAFEKEIREEYGKDSPEYVIRCLGKFYKGQAISFIPLKLQEKVMARKHPLTPKGIDADSMKNYEKDCVIGVDCALVNDRSAIVLREGFQAKILYSGKTNINTLANKVKDFALSMKVEPKIHVDEIGIGYALLQTLQKDDDIKHLVVPVHVGKQASDSKRYYNIRSEINDIAKTWLKYGVLDGDKRWKEMSSFGFDQDANYRLQIELKATIRSNRPSCDIWDAFCDTFYIPSSSQSEEVDTRKVQTHSFA